MTDDTINLDAHRGMAAQKATDVRRLVAEAEANEKALRARQDALEGQLLAAPSRDWCEAADKARVSKDGRQLSAVIPRASGVSSKHGALD